MIPLERADTPGPEQALLLRAALLDDARAVERAWSTWSARVREGEESRADGRLLPLVCRNLVRQGLEPPARLRTAYAGTFGANARLLDVAAEALRVLADAGIETLALKGVALLLLDYRDLGSRPMSDVDVLVPAERAPAAVAALRAAGWRGGDVAGRRRAGMHACVLTHASEATLDLHWHALYEARFPGADRDFWAGAQPLSVGGAPTLALSASDRLLHCVVHGQRWGLAPSAHWIADATTLLRGGGVDPDLVFAQAARLRFVWALRQGLEHVRQVTGPNETGETLLARVRRERVSWSCRVEHAFRVREPQGLLGALPNLWFAHRRARSAEGFLQSLAGAWGLASVRLLPATLAGKLWRRIGPS